MGKQLGYIFSVLLLALLITRPVYAHANLVKSDPPAGALLQAAPQQLVLEFSEELDPSFSRVQLYSSKNQIVNAGPGVIDPATPTIMRLSLGDLPKDSYTALWRARSAADGHVTEGSVPFGVGVAAPTASLIPAPGAPDPATETPPLLDSIARWLNFALAAVAFGGVSFGLLVWRPAFRLATTNDRRPTTDDNRAAQHQAFQRPDITDLTAADVSMTQFIRRVIAIGGGLFLLANLLFLLTQTATAAGVPLLQAIGAPALQMLGGRSGQLILARMVVTVLLIALAWRLPPAGRGAAWPWWVGLALAAGALLTFSLNAHGAAEAQGAALAITLDWLHIAAMVAWLGGLIPLLAGVRAARRAPEQALPLAILIPRFTRLAFPCVVILAGTGLYSYLLHIDGLDLLAATTYGRALVIKLGLFGLLFLLGAVNLAILSPRLRFGGNRLARVFGRTVRAELILGALLLLAVGAMTSVAPSKSAWEAHEQLGESQEAKVGDVDVVLRVAPAQIGDNEWAVDVTDKRPGAQAAASKVLLRFDMQGMQMGKLQAEAQTTDEERYTTRGSFTSMGGRWNVEVVLRRAGFDDITHTFQMDIVRSAMPAP